MSTGIYIHIPFCLKKCNYCSFVSYPGKPEEISAYMDALVKEMQIRALILTPEERTVDSVYVGGGTPTCLSGHQLAGMMANIFTLFNIDANAEITVEANPGTVDRSKLKTLAEAGFNRLSLGFQACDDDLLGVLGRVHSYPEAEAAFGEARRAGFDNINIDLIFAIPGQSFEKWHRCLKRVAGLGPEHISAYGMQLEENTPLHNMVRQGILEECPEDLDAEMYADLMETLGAYGYVHYEVSNFARPGRYSRHNLRYWQNRQYLGFGVAAHSYLGRRRFSNETGLGQYVRRLESGELPVCWEEEIDRQTEMSETVFLGLRLLQGLDTGEFRERFGQGIEEVYGQQLERLKHLDLIETADNRIYLTRRGLMLGNVVFAEFV